MRSQTEFGNEAAHPDTYKEKIKVISNKKHTRSKFAVPPLGGVKPPEGGTTNCTWFRKSPNLDIICEMGAKKHKKTFVRLRAFVPSWHYISCT
ncbi:hypothetical protein QUF80_17380 [Desulfococcaceae bacterium HSG8]|nr:hypothetical protein [Desulfococcaceae bacterium HSG8]